MKIIPGKQFYYQFTHEIALFDGIEKDFMGRAGIFCKCGKKLLYDPYLDVLFCSRCDKGNKRLERDI